MLSEVRKNIKSVNDALFEIKIRSVDKNIMNLQQIIQKRTF